MSIIQRIQADSDVLNVHVTGKFSLKEAKRNFLEMLDAVARYQTPKVLLDGRTVTGNPETMERFYYGEFVAQSVANRAARGEISPATKFAYVLKEPVLDPRRLGETVAVNRGMILKAFDNLEDARQWLGKAPPRKA